MSYLSVVRTSDPDPIDEAEAQAEFKRLLRQSRESALEASRLLGALTQYVHHRGEWHRIRVIGADTQVRQVQSAVTAVADAITRMRTLTSETPITRKDQPND